MSPCACRVPDTSISSRDFPRPDPASVTTYYPQVQVQDGAQPGGCRGWVAGCACGGWVLSLSLRRVFDLVLPATKFLGKSRSIVNSIQGDAGGRGKWKLAFYSFSQICIIDVSHSAQHWSRQSEGREIASSRQPRNRIRCQCNTCPSGGPSGFNRITDCIVDSS